MPRLNRPSVRLATLGADRQDTALRHANGACTAVDAVILQIWRRLIKAITAPPGRVLFHPGVYARVLDVLRQLPRELVATVEDRLTRLAWWGFSSAGHIAVEAVPAHRLEPEVRDLLLAPPPPEQVAAIVYADTPAGPWWERIEALTRLAKPGHIALTVAAGYALGKTPREIAKELQPIMQGVQASARRVARTEGMRVAHESQLDTWDGLGDLIVGYQIHAQRDQHTRPWHARRDGRVYYKQPGPGQLGLDRMPRPPLESPDPRDRPAKAPQVAHNCRCFLTPVLRTET